MESGSPIPSLEIRVPFRQAVEDFCLALPTAAPKIGLAAERISLSFSGVSKAPKTVPISFEGLDQVPFEEALKRLGSIVEAMEGDELPLDQLLTRFEEGTRLARHCQDQLGAAELKITQLEQNLAGELSSKSVAFADDTTT